MEPAVPYRLVIESAENQGMLFPLRGGVAASIGRGPQNTIQIIDTRMSRNHARIDWEDGAWVLRDLESRNGSMVNAVAVTGPVKLNPGDQVQIGNTLFSFEAEAKRKSPSDTSDSGIRLLDNVTDLQSSHIIKMPSFDSEREISKVNAVPQEINERLRSIYQIGNVIQSYLDLDEVLKKVMEIIVQVLKPAQACIMLYDKERDALVPKVIHRPKNKTSEIVISASVIRQAMEQRVAVVMTDGDAKNQQLRAAESIIIQKINSAICVPLLSKGEVLGALYADVRGSGHQFTDGDVQWATGVAGQAALAIAISMLHAQSLAQHKQEQEIEIARTIQMNLLPKVMPTVAGYEFGGLSRPARMVGGDYFDMIPLEDGNIVTVIADVSGKGVPAAILVASFRSAFRIEAQGLTTANLLQVMDKLNDMIHHDTGGNMFITVVLGLLEPKERRFTYCNAGHVYPILRTADGSIRELDTGGSVMGIMPGMVYETATVTLPEDSMLVFVTDGVIDALDAAQEGFGNQRLMDFIQTNAGLGAQEFCQHLNQAVLNFQGKAEQFDDLTVTVLRSKAGKA